MSPKNVRKSKAKASIDLMFKPLEFVVTLAEVSAKTEEDRRKAENAEKIVKLLKKTLQDIAILTVEE